MRFRRGIVSYILWALYGLTVCAALTLQIRTISLTFLREETLWYLPAAAGCVLFLFAGCFLPIRLICRKSGGKDCRGSGSRQGGKETAEKDLRSAVCLCAVRSFFGASAGKHGGNVLRGIRKRAGAGGIRGLSLCFPDLDDPGGMAWDPFVRPPGRRCYRGACTVPV